MTPLIDIDRRKAEKEAQARRRESFDLGLQIANGGSPWRLLATWKGPVNLTEAIEVVREKAPRRERRAFRAIYNHNKAIFEGT